MSRRFLLLLPIAGAAVLLPVGIAAAHSGDRAGARVGGQSAPQAPAAPRGVGSDAGWGSVLEPPRPGSGIDTTKLIPGLTVTYGAATGGLFASPPTNPASGYVSADAHNKPPAVGEIDSFLSSDGKTYYRVVNRTPTGTSYSH
jgi:hypothetical protein